jgi:Cation transporting ATPase, C-terminus.
MPGCFGQDISAFRGLSKNKSFIFIAFLIVIGQVAIVQFGGTFFRTVPLSLRDWVLVVIFSSIILWAAEFIKFIHRKNH